LQGLKIYLDTSVFGYLVQEEEPEKMKATLQLWECIKDGQYEACTSGITINEILRCEGPKRQRMLDYMDMITCDVLPDASDATKEIAKTLIDQGILTQKSEDDCLHIAHAVVNQCDIVVSWNFKHMVNIRVIRGVRQINLLLGYKAIEILSPESLVYRLGD